MAIITNLKSLTPRRQAYRREITLMSKGFSNPKAWPGGKLIVYPWDNRIDEIVLNLGRKADVSELMYTVLANVCDLNGASVDDFVLTEMETVFLVARSIAGGGTIGYEAVCPFCRHTARESIQVPEELARCGEKAEGYPGFDTFTLPDCADVVAARPLLIRDNKVIETRLKEPTNQLTELQLRTITPIVSVNNGRPDTAEEAAIWFDALSPADATFLEQQVTGLSPRLDNKIPHTCDRCQHEFSQTLHFNQKFFR